MANRATALFNSGLDRLDNETYELFIKSVLGLDIGFDLGGFLTSDLSKATVNTGAVSPQSTRVAEGPRPKGPVHLKDNPLDLQTAPANGVDEDLAALPGYGQNKAVTAAAHAMHYTRHWNALKEMHDRENIQRRKSGREATGFSPEWSRIYAPEAGPVQQAAKRAASKQGSNLGQLTPTSKSFLQGIAELVQQVHKERTEGRITRRQAMTTLFTMKEPNTHTDDLNESTMTTPTTTGGMVRTGNPVRTGDGGYKRNKKGPMAGGLFLRNAQRPVEYADRANMIVAGLQRIKSRFEEHGIPDGSTGHQGHPSLARTDARPLRTWSDMNPRDLLADSREAVVARMNDTATIQGRTGQTKAQIIAARDARAEKRSNRFKQGAEVTGFTNASMDIDENDNAVMGGVKMPKFEEGFTTAARRFAEEVGTDTQQKGLKWTRQMSEERSRETKGKIAARLRMNAPKSE